MINELWIAQDEETAKAVVQGIAAASTHRLGIGAWVFGRYIHVQFLAERDRAIALEQADVPVERIGATGYVD